MRRTAGIKGNIQFSFDEVTELKRCLLLFDLIGISELKMRIDLIREKHKHSCDIRLAAEELSLLLENDLLFNIESKGSTAVKKGMGTRENIKEFYELLEKCQEAIKPNKNPDKKTEVFDSFARLKSFLLNIEDVARDFYSVPIVSTFPEKGISGTKTDVINLVLEKFPFPNGKIPWQKIAEFKSDARNVGRLTGLRTWINRMSASGLTVDEIKDELEYNLFLYEESLNLNKIKYTRGNLQTIVVGTAELVENLAKFNLSKIADGAFSSRQLKADLLLAEIQSPGHELAYIYKAKQELS